jgi:hypothetical protein
MYVLYFVNANRYEIYVHCTIVQLYFGGTKNVNFVELNIYGKVVQGKKTTERKDDCTTCA